MSSHREAPEISKDPVADNTDVYVFVSPDAPKTVTIACNWLPFEEPAGGPNFYRFGDDVLYEIFINNTAGGGTGITYRFRFTTQFANPNTFLYNTGPITSLTDKNWNIRQSYSVSKVVGDPATAAETMLADNVPTPPCNIGPRSTPNYDSVAQSAVFGLSTGELVFAGQRADPFYVDVGSIFDLGTLRPFENLHLIPTPAAPGVNTLNGYNVHTIALQIPMTLLTGDGSMPTDPTSPKSVIGVWASASRQQAAVRDMSAPGGSHNAGPFTQVSRLANPLINEVIIPTGMKDLWNASNPSGDSQFAQFYLMPELAQLLPVLYPGVFPNLAALNASGAPRKDLAAILLTGIPGGLIPGFQNNTGTTMADLVRLNMAIPPSSNPNPSGLVGGDPAGFPNGRRPLDNVTAIELQAVAGVVYPLIDKSFKPDAAASKLTDGTMPDMPYLNHFPYIASPYAGYYSEHGTLPGAPTIS